MGKTAEISSEQLRRILRSDEQLDVVVHPDGREEQRRPEVPDRSEQVSRPRPQPARSEERWD